ncbi:hypothetical protein HDU98_001849 [Podochytrium sp. JEL0797]|nr:hypothetical protein HDU98_001849 [Podochytrium sp. JEL0797]
MYEPLSTCSPIDQRTHFRSDSIATLHETSVRVSCPPTLTNLAFLLHTYPTHVDEFLVSLKRTLGMLPVFASNGHSTRAFKVLQRELLECFSTKTPIGPNSAITHSLCLAETVSFLSLWCNLKRQNVSIDEFRDMIDFESSTTSGAWSNVRNSAAFRTLCISTTPEAFLFNAGLVLSTMLQAETATLDMYSCSVEKEQPQGMEKHVFFFDTDWADKMSKFLQGLPKVSLSSFTFYAWYIFKGLLKYLLSPMFVRFVLIGIVLFNTAWLMMLVQMFSDDDVLAHGRSLTPLNDTFLEEFVPQVIKSLPHRVVNIPVTISLVGGIFLSLFMNFKNGDPLKKLRRSMVVLTALYVCRSITMAGTRLPPSNPHLTCEPFFDGHYNIASESLKMLVTKIESCSDMMFSGHTLIVSLFSMRIWFDVAPLSRIVKFTVRVMLVGMYAFAVTAFIGVRMHYSIDVVVAALLAVSWSVAVEMAFEMRPFMRQESWGVKFMRWVDCVDGWKWGESRHALTEGYDVDLEGDK